MFVSRRQELTKTLTNLLSKDDTAGLVSKVYKRSRFQQRAPPANEGTNQRTNERKQEPQSKQTQSLIQHTQTTPPTLPQQKYLLSKHTSEPHSQIRIPHRRSPDLPLSRTARPDTVYPRRSPDLLQHTAALSSYLVSSELWSTWLKNSPSSQLPSTSEWLPCLQRLR